MQTPNQKGQRVKGKVNDEIESHEITAVRLALNVAGKEERVWTVMCSRQDIRTTKRWSTLSSGSAS